MQSRRRKPDRNLDFFLENLDLSTSQTEQSVNDDADSTDSSDERLESPKLWTHERVPLEEDFSAQWDDRIAAVEQTLSGVPLPLEEGMSEASLTGIVPGVALLYAGLSSGDILMRLEFFSTQGRSLTSRLRDLSNKLHEKQGLARARRAIASAFDSTEVEGSSSRTAPIESGPRDPKLGFLGHYEQPGRFAFRVGDIVVHRGHGQVGVVAERFRVCQLGEEWVAANMPRGMTAWQPFYTILVSVPGQGFSRHGAQSSHRRWDIARDGGEPSPVQHPEVNRLFGKFDASAARYEPLVEASSREEVVPEWDKAQ
mmetsp:Transcript_7984/g.16758  ORF Transcript_7984/g.16758 Transcript_7984/m.16758 type:complete len:312 (-) Transcript_7984:93-1028(-)